MRVLAVTRVVFKRSPAPEPGAEREIIPSLVEGLRDKSGWADRRREIEHFLATGEHLAPPLVAEVRRALLEHLQDHYGLYGEYTGVRSARKHIGWYVRSLPGADAFRQQMNTLETADRQLAAVGNYLDGLAEQMDRWPAQSSEPVLEMEL